MTDPTSGWFPTAVQGSAVWMAGGLIALGLFGFIPGMTTDVGSLEFAGAGSAAYVFGVFQVSILHNLIHLASGIIALFAAGRPGRSRMFLAVGGVFYMVLAIYGWLLDQSTAPNVLPVNDADDWLHFGLAFVLTVLAIGAPGLTSTERRARRGLA